MISVLLEELCFVIFFAYLLRGAIDSLEIVVSMMTVLIFQPTEPSIDEFVNT